MEHELIEALSQIIERPHAKIGYKNLQLALKKTGLVYESEAIAKLIKERFGNEDKDNNLHSGELP